MNIKKVLFFTGHKTPEVNDHYMNLTLKGEGIFKNYKFIFNKIVKDYDYIVIFERLASEVKTTISTDRIVFIAGEGSSIKKYKDKFLQQFGHVVTCQKRIKHKSVTVRAPGHSWFFTRKTYDQLLTSKFVKKTRLLSIVVSNNTITKGHRDRISFALKLKKYFGNQVDLLGRGFEEYEDKWDMIAPYQYTVAIENSVEDHWITEKLTDCFASHTFPFYIGAPNLKEYYNPKSFVHLNIKDFKKSVQIIENILNDKEHYKNHLNYLIESKIKYINEHCIIPMVCNFIDTKIDSKTDNPSKFSSTIYPEKKELLHYKFIKDTKKIIRFVIYKLLYFFKL